MKTIWSWIGVFALAMLVSFCASCTPTPSTLMAPQSEIAPGNIEVQAVEYIPQTYRAWESVEQFREWFKANNVGRIPGDVPGDDIDCDDYADRLQRIALEQGYAVSVALVDHYGTYYGVKVRDATTGHAGCMVDINEQYYYVEPYPWRDYIWRIGSRD